MPRIEMGQAPPEVRPPGGGGIGTVSPEMPEVVCEGENLAEDADDDQVPEGNGSEVAGQAAGADD